MKNIPYLAFVLMALAFSSCDKEGLSDEEIPIPSRNSKLNVTVELCENNDCLPLSGKIVNIYEYEDEAMGFEEGVKLAQTNNSGVASFGWVEFESVYVTVRYDGDLDISQVSLPRNSISHHFVTFVK